MRARLTALVAEASLAEDRPLADELKKLGSASALRASSAAAAGDLRRALRLAGFSDELAALGSAWPRALHLATRVLDELPTKEELYLPALAAAAYFFLILLLEIGVLTILSIFVFPTLRGMSPDATFAPPHAWFCGTGVKAAPTVCAVGMGLIAIVGLLGARESGRFSGWGRHLKRAREASLLAALLMSDAPTSVIAAWTRRMETLQGLGLPQSVDLMTIAIDSGEQARQTMFRFIILFRIIGMSLLAFLALAITLHVLGCIALLPGSMG